MAFGVAFSIFAFVFSAIARTSALSSNHYVKTCPNVDSIVTNAVKSAVSRDKTLPAALIRMHFHDCFLRGCDGSVLLDSKGHQKAEKDAQPNQSLHGYFVIDNAKKELEAACPGVVSCADILALAARDAVVLAGGPYWYVPKGRKDGRVSRASDVAKLPSPTFGIAQLQKSFAQRGLSLDDLVALSGAHTLGFAHCSSFENRIHNFNATHDTDPTLHPTLASNLAAKCPPHNAAKNAGAPMDPFSSKMFDNTYYKLVLQSKTLFSSDHALLGFPKTKGLVYKFAGSKKAFSKAFVNSIIKLSSITGGQEVRKNCRVVN